MVKKVWELNEVSLIKVVDNVRIDLTSDERNQLLIDWNAHEDEKEARETLATKIATDKTNANNKLKALGLTDDEIKAIKGIS